MLSQDLKNKVQQYLSGETSIADLDEWTAERLRRYLSDPDSADADIVCAIEQGLAQMSDKIMTEAEFRELLSEALALYALILAPPASTSTGSTGSASSRCSLAIAEAESTLALTCLSVL
jgi:hypothetical protein